MENVFAIKVTMMIIIIVNASNVLNFGIFIGYFFFIIFKFILKYNLYV